MQLHFATSLYPDWKTVQDGAIDFSPEAAPQALNLQQPAVSYVPYDLQLNHSVAESFFRDPGLREAFGWSITEEMIHFFAAIPEYYSDAKDL
ncbi:hypothetical protein J31TS4_22980 [Paenibacillus sp. J31TS4]|uniref:hypothetical protein n=1 Tax=Paenibacillus sp. J31TS4 TaxID=2807195 RepID=UPI001B1626AC|nr:hypothetical protein [Paenibacillus sp. J31TS4]GIP39018.1 hypothetical protein J31TS4_22980 [Paenibacillus sp. J31TS4]